MKKYLITFSDGSLFVCEANNILLALYSYLNLNPLFNVDNIVSIVQL